MKFGASLARWLGLQIAGKAVSFALGLPAVTGLIMAAVAYAQGLPLAWGFFTTLGVMAFTATTANQARAFSVSYSVADKLYVEAVRIDMAKHTTTGENGYLMAVHFKNDADIPLEFEVKKASASVNGRVAAHNPNVKRGKTAADSVFGYMVGLAPLGVVKDGILEGEVEVDYIYGRVGKMKHRRTEALGVRAQTGPHGDVINKVMYVRETASD